jgi:hypothetical protein
LANTVSYPDNFWTSGNDFYREGQFYWDTTGNTMGPYLNWDAGMPNNGNNETGPQHCMQLEKSRSHMWNDLACSLYFRFICEVKLSSCKLTFSDIHRGV